MKRLDGHAADRAEQRAGITLTPEDAAEIWAKITDGRAIDTGSRRGTQRYVLTVRGRAIVVIVNKKRRRLVTVYERPGKYPANRRRA